MRMFVKTMLREMLAFVNCLVPKSNIILFNSFPDFSDNAWELYVYILRNRKDVLEKYDLYWSVGSKNNVPQYANEKNIRIIHKKSIKGLWLFLRSKYIFSTHGYFAGVTSAKNQIQINLWHGCGYKTTISEERVFVGDYAIATSYIYKKILADIFNIDMERVLVTGLPRNDLLFNKDISCLPNLGINKNEYNKIFIWMPTYRKAAFGHCGVDGCEKSFGLGSLTYDDYKIINDALVASNICLLIKLHPMESLNFVCDKSLTNIVCVNTNELARKNIKLYDLLKETDVLLSDYSSVIVDYLLLDKPIAMVLSDLEEYRNSRGFVFENVKEYFPGPIIKDVNSLIEYLYNFECINKKWEVERLKITKQLHAYIDDDSCKRVCDSFL